MEKKFFDVDIIIGTRYVVTVEATDVEQARELADGFNPDLLTGSKGVRFVEEWDTDRSILDVYQLGRRVSKWVEENTPAR